MHPSVAAVLRACGEELRAARGAPGGAAAFAAGPALPRMVRTLEDLLARVAAVGFGFGANEAAAAR